MDKTLSNSSQLNAQYFMQYKISKRKFLITITAAAAAVCAWEPLISLCKAVEAYVPAPQNCDHYFS
jgi:hypothetical protein